MIKTDVNRSLLSVCDISPKKYGSFEEFLVFLTEKLNSNGFEHIIIFRDKPIESVEQALLDKGAKIKIFKPSKYSFLNLWEIYCLIKNIRPQIIHFHFYPIYSLVNYLKFTTNIKIVYTDHMGCKRTKSGIKKLMRRLYYQTHFMLYDVGIDRVICVSNYVKSKYFDEYNIKSNKLQIIYNGINVSRFKKKESMIHLNEKYNVDSEFFVTCVGLREEKGCHYLMKAAPLVLKEIPNVSFIFVGEGKCRSRLEHLAENLNIMSSVKFTGNVQDLSEAIYSISSIVVIPSLTEEAFCFVAAEAMAAEAQVIAFDSGAIKEVLYDSNCIVSKDYILLAERIIHLLKYKNNAEASKMHVTKNFSLESSVSAHLRLYNELSASKFLDIVN